MTKYVGKGTNRAAAEARKNKHAQRTPLPDRPVPHDAVRIAREMVEEKRKKQ